MSKKNKMNAAKNMEEESLRLAKPIKKGLLHLVFSRFFIFILLILVQVAIVVTIYVWLDYIPWVSGFYILFIIGMIIYLFNCSMDSTAKLTWMLLIAVLPLAGAIFLLYTQYNPGNGKLKKNVLKRIEEASHAIEQPSEVLDSLQQDHSGTGALHSYLNSSGCFPVYDNTEAVYFSLGEQKFEAVLEELRKAQSYIFMEYFIIEEGYMWGKILEILIEKAKAGVDVRVMYDGMCEISQLPPGYWKLLEEHGIRAKAFSAIKPVLSTHYNYRDHRKILVIDGKVAFNGGVNLADEYINRVERFGHWKDTAVMLKGPAAQSFALMFLQMWDVDEQTFEGLPDAGEQQKSGNSNCGYVMPYCDCPLDQEKVGEAVYMDILNRAEKYVHIMTPYLILDGELETALKFASRRGVDVKLILPGIPDKKAAYALAKSHYKSLVKAGIRIYEYTPGFVHAKVFVSDDIKAVVGTINLDYRSLYHHFECATYLYGTSCIPDIEKDFMTTLSKCREVTPDTIRHESIRYKVVGKLLKFVAPLM